MIIIIICDSAKNDVVEDDEKKPVLQNWLWQFFNIFSNSTAISEYIFDYDSVATLQHCSAQKMKLRLRSANHL